MSQTLQSYIHLKRVLKQSDPARKYGCVYDGSNAVKPRTDAAPSTTQVVLDVKILPSPSAYELLLPHHF